MRYLPKMTREQSDAAALRMIAIEKDHGHVLWASERKVTRDFIGFCGILPPGASINEHKIGWRLARHAWGMGYAREAAEASLAWAWASLEVPAIMAITNLTSMRSWGLMERLGMKRQALEDFDHLQVPEGDPLRPHTPYRINRPTFDLSA
jgi:RimJ/RimL family protein N-acetyltransferase